MSTDFLNGLLAPDVQQDGVASSPRRKIWDFVNVTITDDPSGKKKIFTFPTPESDFLVARLATAAALPANSRTGNVLQASGNGALSVDGEVVVSNDVVLVKDESTGAHNGPYTVTQVGSGGSPWILTRHASFDEAANFAPGLRIAAEEGDNNAGDVFTLITDEAITLNTTALEFVSPSTTVSASEVAYSNGTSGLTATDVQAAIDELDDRVDDVEAGILANDSVSNAELANMTAYSVKANPTSSSADPQDLTLAANTIVGRSSTGDIDDKACTDAGFALLSSTLPPLVNEANVDLTFSTTITRNGSFLAPYATLAAAFAGTSGSMSYRMQAGDHGPTAIPSGRASRFCGEGGARPTLGVATCAVAATGTSVRLERCDFTSLTVTSDTAARGFTIVSVAGGNVGAISLATTDGGLFLLTDNPGRSTVASIAWRGAAYLNNIHVTGTTAVVNANAAGTLNPGFLRAHGCYFGGNISCGTAELIDCDISGVTTITATGNVVIDLATLYTNPSVGITGGGAFVYAVPNLAAVRTALGVAPSSSIALSALATQADNTVLANATGSTAVPTAVAMAANKFGARGSTGNWEAKTITDLAITQLAGLVASGHATSVNNAADAADVEYTVAADTTVQLEVTVVAHATGGAKSKEVYAVNAERVTTGTPTVSAQQAQLINDSGLTVAITGEASGIVRVRTTNALGAAARIKTFVRLKDSYDTVAAP